MQAKINVSDLSFALGALEQAEYIGVNVEGPFKPEHYRY